MQTIEDTTDRGVSLRERREAAGLTQCQLANLADCSLTTIERIERGYRPRRSPALARLYAACRDQLVQKP